MIPTTGKSFKKSHEVKVTCPGWFNMESPIEAFFPLNNHCYDHFYLYLLPIFIAAVVREIYSFIKIMQPISPNCNWENGVKQIKITEENLSQSSIFYQLLRTKTTVSGEKYIKHFVLFLPIFTSYLLSGWVDVIYLTCRVFHKSPWWLVWIFCAPTPLT